MSRPHALVLTPRLPWPLDDGGRVVLWQSLWAAAASHEVTLVSFDEAARAREVAPEPLRSLCAEVVRVPFRPPSPAVSLVRGLVGRWPYTIGRYQDGAFARAVASAVKLVRPAFALVNNLHLAPYVDALDGVPMILREQNLEHRWMERYAKCRGATPAGLYARAQARRLKGVERDLCGRAALVLAIHDGEAAALRALAPGARVRTLPIGIDLARFREPAPSDPPVVLLPGSFLWEPNVDGALRFLRDGWRQVRAAAPRARLVLAGKGPGASLRAAVAAASDAGVELHGDVPSMEEELARASVVVVPLWAGAGARVKIVEAMAARVPVVATPLAVEGLGLEPECHFVQAETATQLGERIGVLLGAPAERLRLGAQGRALAEEHWCLQSVAALQSRLIAETLADIGGIAGTGGIGGSAGSAGSVRKAGSART